MVMCQREYGESTLLDWVVLEGFSEEVTFELRVNEQEESVLGKWGRSRGCFSSMHFYVQTYRTSMEHSKKRRKAPEVGALQARGRVAGAWAGKLAGP